ncbi:hypothetical protein TEA_007833 [Camellia sinensis var. sinensis]|uniref:Uncharacterized protein n=1 Tax=Camellia sinensis var. sinensis TaxID=542762 RepID=A0A4S4EBI2_CAMSN|nr:hypothetical protein TEA_007833 [Camellia sinensis var. sinensis]
MVGFQGPLYGGTGCFHRRKVIYGLSPDDNGITRKLSKEALLQTFGRSMEFTKSAAKILSGIKTSSIGPKIISSYIETAYQVAGCDYEYGSSWGREGIQLLSGLCKSLFVVRVNKVGWMYGSTTEDVLTGHTIHGRGWKSTFCSPNPPAFHGCAPPGGPATMIQQKRWATGLLEILFTPKNPFILTLNGKLQFRQCLAYTCVTL